jgi:hypothetical protein
MRQPSPPGTTIDAKRKQIWHDRFLNYRYPPTHDAIASFLKQFGRKHRDVGARLLDSVEVVTRVQIEQAFKTLMENLPGWHRDKSKRKGEWRFVPYSFSAGESGDQMIAAFRQAMGMRQQHYNELFIHPHNLTDQKLRGDDTVVLVDDFSGSGNQACESWNKLFRELVGGVGTAYLIVVAATTAAQESIRNKTDLQVLCEHNLDASDNIFSEECGHFSEEEKQAILSHCTKHFPNEPRGYGECGLLYVLQHDCPNNSIPLLHKQKKNKWVPLFPRSRITSS